MGLKRILDILGASIGLLVFAPLMLYAVIQINRESGSPVFYNRMRAGQRGNPFKLYKFRTMNETKSSDGELLPDSERITPIGARIRSSSLDELPQLLNVLKGDMSLVGPRPLLLDYIPLYNSEQRRRLDVPQGITGWAQVNGRNATTWPARLANDVWYVDNWSLFLDLKIIAMTIYKVLKRDGISAEGEATMSRFVGANKE